MMRVSSQQESRNLLCSPAGSRWISNARMAQRPLALLSGLTMLLGGGSAGHNCVVYTSAMALPSPAARSNAQSGAACTFDLINCSPVLESASRWPTCIILSCAAGPGQTGHGQLGGIHVCD